MLSIAEVQYFLLEGYCWGGGLCVVSQGLGCVEEFLECVKLCGDYHGIAFPLSKQTDEIQKFKTSSKT